MPLIVKKRGDKFRLIEANTGRIAKTATGKAVDGGGKSTESAIKRQIRAINISKARRKGHRI